ncbi:MAG: rod shape-determining protein [Clostridia bacterium]|nr:rod shape-determining protein [Clostridia bacterium]
MFETLIAADVGSSVTRLAVRNAVSENETRAALDPEDTRRVLAVGNEARKLLNTAEAYPVRGGGIADVSLAAIMLRRFALDLLKRRPLFGASLVLAVPLAANPLSRAAALEAGREAGFRRVGVIDSLIAGAEGAGLDYSGSGARMLVDVGRDSVKTAIFASGGLIRETFSPFGSSAADRAIRDRLARETRLIIGSRTAERIKKSLAAPLVRVCGRDLKTGLPATKDIPTASLRQAADGFAEELSREIVAAISSVHPEAASDLVDSGVTLTGGGALLFGLGSALEERLGIPVSIAQNAESAVIDGLVRQLRRAAAQNLSELTARAKASGTI